MDCICSTPTNFALWLDRVAGNLYVNRGITGAIVRRQPFGGWKKSAIGTGTKAADPTICTAWSTGVDTPVTKPVVHQGIGADTRRSGGGRRARR